jgi:hypothetical protein
MALASPVHLRTLELHRALRGLDCCRLLHPGFLAPQPTKPPARISKQETEPRPGRRSAASRRTEPREARQPRQALGTMPTTAAHAGRNERHDLLWQPPWVSSPQVARRHGRWHAPRQVEACLAAGPSSPRTSRRFRPKRSARAPARFRGPRRPAGARRRARATPRRTPALA